MKNLDVLFAALHYIEVHLTDSFTQEELAAACHFSLSGMQKLFRYALHMSLKDYVTKRRMTEAAKELTRGATVMETAMRYQYNSSEVFTRAFSRTWGLPPSSFKKERRFTGLFPKITHVHMEELIMKRQLDFSEFYNTLKSYMGNYVLYFDIKGMTHINQISNRLGDVAIREALARIEAAATDAMLPFRIGGDEFALLTDTSDPAAANAVAGKVIARNGEPVEYEGQSAPLHLWGGGMRLMMDNVRYQELFDGLQHNINEMKTSGSDVFILE